MAEAEEIARGLTRNERDCLLHTLGLNQHPPQDRNYFAAGTSGADNASLAALAARGVTECYARPEDNPHMPYNMYRATDLGRAVASELRKMVARSNTQKEPDNG